MGALNGTVKRLVTDKGFGFVKGTNGTEYFFHRSAAEDFDALAEGQAVKFDEDPSGAKGPRAKNVSAS
jgi:CspA family cold shock protein